jgi:spermidine/putrescine transport system ATP-binding protein
LDLPEQALAPIVELRSVTKSYGDHAALADFSLEVRRGEFLTLLGPSGSGKTTVLRLVAGFEQPQSGQVWIAGRDASGRPPYQRNVNTVFQHYALFPHLTVFENVAFGLEQKKTARVDLRRRVQSVLELVELPGKEDRYPNQLSGGEKQRVALARAVVLEPAVLLLDEPLGALDKKLRRQMQVELKRLHERLKITFLFVTHDQQEALVMSDRVAVLNHGRLEQIGPAEEIYEQPRTRFVAEFMGVENFLEARFIGQSDTLFKFETKSGISICTSNSGGLAAGSPAVVAVRPEALRVLPGGSDQILPNCAEGKIVEAIYEGESTRHTVQLPTGEQLVARTAGAARTSSAGVEPGASATVTWGPEQTLIFPA